jgi:hypothetical protein
MLVAGWRPYPGVLWERQRIAQLSQTNNPLLSAEGAAHDNFASVGLGKLLKENVQQ